VSVYSERLARLKKDILRIKEEKKTRKNKKFNANEKIMIDFINGVTSSASFKVEDKSIILRVGDTKKGFRHILEAHYCSGCRGELSTMEILNMIDIMKKGIKLENEGVSNTCLVVYFRTKTQEKLVLKPIEDDTFIVTAYSIS
jgi:hypothetical protein